jgi:hypothetical protein
MYKNYAYRNPKTTAFCGMGLPCFEYGTVHSITHEVILWPIIVL